MSKRIKPRLIVHVPKGEGNAESTVNYMMTPNDIRRRKTVDDEILIDSGNGERLGMRFGQGIDPSAMSSGHVDKIVQDLEYRAKSAINGGEMGKRGKLTRHAILSLDGDDCREFKKQGGTEEELQELLMNASEDFCDTFAPKSNYFGQVHGDKNHLHCHLEIENVDISLKRSGEKYKRLEWSTFEMNKVDFTDLCIPGKGSKKNKEKKVQKDIEEAGRPLLGRKKADQALGDSVMALLGNAVNLRGDTLVDEVEKLGGSDWSVNRFSTRGALLKKPSVTFSGATVRFNRIEDHLDNVLSFEKSKSVVVPEPKKDEFDIAIEFLNDADALFKKCESAKGKYESDRKRDVRIPAVHEFLQKWSDVSKQLKSAKSGLKLKLDAYVSKLGEFDSNTMAYSIDAIDDSAHKALRIFSGIEKAPVGESPNKRGSTSKEKCVKCGKLQSACSCIGI